MLTNGFLRVNTTYYHLTAANYNEGVTISPLENDGFATAGGQVSLQAAPTFDLTSNDVDAILEDFDVIANALTGAGVKVYYQQPSAEGVREATCSEYTIAKGIMTLESLSLAQGTVATITIKITPTSSDGIANPVAILDNVAMPTIAALEEACTLGVVSINGTAVSRVQSVDLQFGTAVSAVTSDGHTFPTFAYVNTHAPAVTVTGVNSREYVTLTAQKAIKLNGTTGLSIAIRKTVAGVVTANVSKTLTIKEGLVSLVSNSGTQGSLNNATLNIAVAHNRTDTSPILVA